MRLRAICFCTGFVFCAVLLPDEVRSEGFFVSGDLTEVRLQDGQTNRTEFEVYVRGREWLIRFGTNVYSPQFLSSEFGCDGTNIYALNYLDRKAFGKGAERDDFALANGVVTPVRIPPFDFYRTPQIWLAFCARSYGEYLSNGIPCGVIYPGDSNCFLRAELNRDAADPGFISSATIWAWGTALLTSGTVVQLSEPFQDGYKNGAFTVVSYTNWQGMKIPTEFQFDTFYMKDVAQTSNDVSLVYAMSGKVHKIGGVTEEFVPPRLTTRTFIMDYRVPPGSGIEYIRYYSSNRWMNPDQTNFALTVQQEIKVNKTKAPAPNLLKYVAIVALLALPLLGTFFFSKFSKKSSRR